MRVGFGKKVLMAAAVAALGATAMNANAAAIIFANFAQTDPGSQPWVFTNSGATSSFSIAGAPVNFTSAGGIGQILNYTGTATANMTAMVTGPATSVGGFDRQGLTGTLAFTNGSDNILTIVFTGAILGIDGSSSSGQAADSNIIGQAIAYSSDHLIGSFIAPFSFSISLTQNPALSVNGNGYLNSFNASATGSFSGDSSGAAPTPLPAAAWGGLGMLGVAGGAGAFARRRRAAR